MPDYSKNDPRGWMGDATRGAALGRPTITKAPTPARLKMTLRRVRLDSGGYDSLGTYFGIDAPLYWCASNDSESSVDFMLRASSRAAAKALVRQRYPRARFFN